MSDVIDSMERSMLPEAVAVALRWFWSSLVVVGVAVPAARAQERVVPPTPAEDGQDDVPAPAPVPVTTEPQAELPDAEAPSQKPNPATADRAPDAQPVNPNADLRAALAEVDQTGSPPQPPAEGTSEPANEKALPPKQKRELPNYDGREAQQTDAGDIVRWIPRVALYPAYLFLQYGIRTPTVWAVAKVEETHWADKVTDFFTWDDGRAYAFPFVTFDFGVRPNVGAIFRWNEMIPRHDFAATFFGGPGDLWAAVAQIDQKLFRDEEALIRWRGGYVRRPDNPFFGVSDLGARCNQLAFGCRYRSAIAEASVSLVGWEQHLNSLSFGATFRHARFSTEETDNPPLTPTETAVLPGFTNGYQVLQPELNFALDNRNEDLDFTRGTGLRLEGLSAFAVDVLDPNIRWFRAGGELAAFYDLGFGQIFSTSLYYQGVLNLSRLEGSTSTRAPIPFYELPFLGGQDQMKSFLRRRLMGANAWAANFEYRYPISWGLDASLFSSIGNTYDDLGEWNLVKSYLNYGLALKLPADRVSAFEAVVGWGSNRLDEFRFEPFDQFRFAFGLNRGF